MAIEPFEYLLHYLRLRMGPASVEEESDGRMLQRFLAHRDEAAFSVLLRRHGAMVLGICRRLLDEPADVEDAFQATFLVLVDRAAAVRKRESVGSFLHGVALRVAHRIRAHARRRQLHERQAPVMPPADPLAPVIWRDLRPILDEELDRLPAKYRAPLILCYLEGKTHEEAARELGWPNGTVCGRLARAREMLRGRLARRGLTLSAAMLSALFAENALPAAVPALPSKATLHAAVLFHSGQQAAGVISVQILNLTREAVKAMLLNKVKWVMVVALTLTVLAGAGIVVQHTLRAKTPPSGLAHTPPAEQPDAGNPKPAAEKLPRRDLQDAPLPAGAIARLGTTRFRQTGHVGRLAFSPDGKTLAAGSEHSWTEGGNYSSVVLWDATTGQATRTFDLLDFAGGSPSALAFSPDGKALAIGIDNSLVMPVSNWWVGISMWDFVSREMRHPLVLRDWRSIHSLAFSPDEEHQAAADDHGGVFLWELAGANKETRLDVLADVSYFVAFSPDKKDLILATRADTRTFGKKGRGEVIFWDIAKRRKRRSFVVDREHFIDAMAVSTDGKTLAVLVATTASLWDIAKGEKIRDLKPGADVRSLAFSGDGKTIALGCSHRMGHKQTGPVYNPADGVVYLLDVATGEELRMPQDATSSCLAFSPDGRLLATGGLDSVVRLWDTQTGKLLTPVGGHNDAVTCVAVSCDGKTVVSGADGGTVCVWDAANGALRHRRRLQFGFGTYAGFGSVRVTPNGQILATLNDTPYGPPDPKPILWDVLTGKELLAMSPPNPRGGPACPIVVSPDGKKLACGVWGVWPEGVTFQECFYETATGKEMGRSGGDRMGRSQVATFTSDGKTLAIAGEADDLFNARKTHALVQVLDGNTFRLIQTHTVRTNTIPDNPRDNELRISFSRDAIVWCLSNVSEVIVWDRLSDKKEVVLRDAAGCKAGISPDGRTLAVLNPQKNVLSLWRRSATTNTPRK